MKRSREKMPQSVVLLTCVVCAVCVLVGITVWLQARAEDRAERELVPWVTVP